MESKKLKKRKQREEMMGKQEKRVQTRFEHEMFCLAARAHDGRGNLIWPDLTW